MLICMCVYCTEENGKLKYFKQTLESLSKTVDWTKHRLIVIDNSPGGEPLIRVEGLWGNKSWLLLKPKENLGTARGINLALKERLPDEVCCKCDDDVTWDEIGWADKLEDTIKANPQLGILGLRRGDVYGKFTQDGDLLYCDDIMGTCTALSPALLDKVGRYVQISDRYGFDDSILAARSLAAGFKNAFLKDVRINHLDEGGTDYTEWKKQEASYYLQEAGTLIDMIRKGKVSYYYPFE